MADLQQNALRDALRQLAADVEALRRRTPSGTFLYYEGLLTASVSDPVSTLGDGFPAAGSYNRSGDIITVEGPLVLFAPGISTVGSGTYRIALPVSAHIAGFSAIIGRATLWDNSGGTRTHVDVVVDYGADYATLVTSAGAVVTHASPVAWATDDRIDVGTLVYRSLS